MMIKRIFGLLFLFVSMFSYGQQDVGMADAFRADGKIYVVVAVILIVLIGLFVYLIKIDKKIKKLEK